MLGKDHVDIQPELASAIRALIAEKVLVIALATSFVTLIIAAFKGARDLIGSSFRKVIQVMKWLFSLARSWHFKRRLQKDAQAAINDMLANSDYAAGLLVFASKSMKTIERQYNICGFDEYPAQLRVLKVLAQAGLLTHVTTLRIIYTTTVTLEPTDTLRKQMRVHKELQEKIREFKVRQASA